MWLQNMGMEPCGLFFVTVMNDRLVININSLKKRVKISVVFLLLVSFAWLFANQAMYSHSHLLIGGQVITHSHPYSAQKDSHSPYQSHQHLPSVAFFLDLISSLNVDSSGFPVSFLFVLGILAIVPFSRTNSYYPEYNAPGTSRAPPRVH
ncbi:MAG: hypothetical protein WCP08_10315 [Prolixibacteraceae bacterium]